MCGISVIIDAPNQPIRADEIQAMTDAVAHRGPDGEGFWTKKNIAFGHRRLAILDLEPARGQQPMKYLNDRYVIIHNGEIYNYLEIRQLLISKNYNFSTQTDTEVIAAAYDCWGEACLAHFNGMWAFVIFDNQKNTVFAARDRFGVKPLYYYQKNTKFYLASEIKQFTTTSGWQPILNETIALDFLQHGLKNHSNDTFFEEVKTLPAAHFLIYNIDNQQFKIKKYYDLSEKSAEKSTKNFESAKEKFTHLLSDAVRLRLRSDVKIGTALSGGLDSSAVTALATGLLGVPTATVSACFPNQENDETLYIHSVTAFLETTNYPAFPCWEEMKKEMQNLIWQQDEPIGSASVFAQSEVFRMAKKQGLTVMLGGQGADEILGGYDAFLRPYFKNMFQKNLLRAIFSVANYARLHRLNWSQLVGYQKNTIAFFRKESAKIFLKTDNFFDFSVKMLSQNPLPSLLHYEDRNSMAWGVESRLPFMDYRLVEFCLQIPDNYKIYYGKRKYILREAMKGKIPDMVYRRYDKLAFATPQDDWMRKNAFFFRNQLEITADEHSHLFDKKELLFGFDVFLQNKKIKSAIFWRVVSFGQWHRLFF